MKPFTDAELTELLARARLNNTRLGCTGLLLYEEGSFLQALEGEAEVTEKLFNKISADKRHQRVVRLLWREIEQRQFGEWCMGFAPLKNVPQHLPGYSEYLRLRGSPPESANAASRLLSAFRDGRLRSYVSS